MIVKTIKYRSKSGKYFLDLNLNDDNSWSYRTNNGTGCLGFKTEQEAIKFVETYIVPNVQPDKNKTPMERIS